MAASLTPLLTFFSPDQIGKLSRYGESVVFESGETVITQGSENNHLYLLLTGSLVVTSSVDTSKVELAKVAPGQSIGEMSIFDPAPTSAGVTAEEASEAWRISKEGLDAFREEHPGQAYDLIGQICRVLSSRLRKHTRDLTMAKI